MKSKNIDLLNVFLILLSLLAAFKLPFELFLFSYAILGPLHYVTEINWLNGKNYFVRERKWIWVFIIAAACIAIPPILRLPALKSLQTHSVVKQFLSATNYLSNQVILVCFLFAIGLVYFKKTKDLFLFLIATIIISSLVLKFVSFSVIVVGVFIPTIIHVYIFTLLFMIFGTLHNKTNAGILAIMFLILVPGIIFFSNIDPGAYLPAETTRTIFMASGFQALNKTIGNVLGTIQDGPFSLSSIAAIKVQIFIAFCYTYHYLNWFSKTSVIGWNKNISRPKLLVIFLIWGTSVFLYWYDYKIGLTALFFLSFFHVLLEFPLNVTSIKGIIAKSRFRHRVDLNLRADKT